MLRLDAVLQTLISRGIMAHKDIYCITYIVNGRVVIDEVLDTHMTEIPDYVKTYMTEDKFDFVKLINDDYFDAIRILWNAKKYISCTKLLFSAIETFGFIDFGPVRNCFISWLDRYCDLTSIGVTSQEIWELRNSLVHMTNLDSHKVRQGTVQRLLPSVANPQNELLPDVDGMKLFHIARFLLVIVPKGVERWLMTYNDDRSKFFSFSPDMTLWFRKPECSIRVLTEKTLLHNPGHRGPGGHPVHRRDRVVLVSASGR